MVQLESEQSLALDISDRNRVQIVHEQMLKLIDILFQKWNMTTQKILQHMDHFPREPSENFQIQGKSTSGYSIGIWGNLTKNPRYKVIEFPEINMSCSLPKPLALSNVAIRMLYSSGPNCNIPYEHQTGQKMAIVGGVLDFDLIDLPELPKIVEPWIIRTSTIIINTVTSPSGHLKNVQYPFSKTSAEVTEEEKNMVSDDQVWPTYCTFHITPNSFVQANAKVMWWDKNDFKWRRDGISEDEISIETGKIKFRTIHFAPTCLVQVLSIFYIRTCTQNSLTWIGHLIQLETILRS